MKKVSPLPKLLVVGDELIVNQIQWALPDEYLVFTASDRGSAVTTMETEGIWVALLDLGLGPSPMEAIEGLRTLDELMAKNPLAKVIIVSGNSDGQNALRALEKGAFDFLAKPVDLDELKIVVRRAHRRIEMERESAEERTLSRRLSFEYAQDGTLFLDEIGDLSPALQVKILRELQNRIKRALVLVEGPFIGPADLELDLALSSSGTLREAKQEFEREIVARKLRDTNGNISRAARALGISRPTLYELMSRYGLNSPTNP